MGAILINQKLAEANIKYKDAIDSCKVLTMEYNMRSHEELTDGFTSLAQMFKQLCNIYKEYNKDGEDFRPLAQLCDDLAIRARLAAVAMVSLNEQLKSEALAELNEKLNQAYTFETITISDKE